MKSCISVKQIYIFSSIIITIAFIMFLNTACNDSLNSSENYIIPQQSKNKLSLSNSSGNRDSIVNKIQYLAKGLSILLKDPEIRKIIYNDFLNSNKVERIIESKELLDKQIAIRSNVNIKEILINLFKGEEKFKCNNLFDKIRFGEIDIYFPIKGQLEKWNASENLYVAAFTATDESESKNFIAYDLKGNEYLLSIDKKPDIPTIVIYPSEKRGNYQRKKLSSFSISTPSEALPPPPPPPPPDLYNYKCEARGICIKMEYDPWPCGEMEIYLKVTTLIDGGVWSGWNEMMWVGGVDAGEWCYDVAMEIYRADKNFTLQIEIWEDDNAFFTGADDFVADAYYSAAYGCNMSYPTNLIRCDFLCNDIRLQDGIYPSNDFDLLDLHFVRWR